MLHWTRTELKTFERWYLLGSALEALCSDAMWGSCAPNSPQMRQIDEMSEAYGEYQEDLKSLMGTTRFNKLMGDGESRNGWLKELKTRYDAKYPRLANKIDCRSDWDS